MGIFLLSVMHIHHSPLAIPGTALLCIALEIPASVAKKTELNTKAAPLLAWKSEAMTANRSMTCQFCVCFS